MKYARALDHLGLDLDGVERARACGEPSSVWHVTPEPKPMSATCLASGPGHERDQADQELVGLVAGDVGAVDRIAIRGPAIEDDGRVGLAVGVDDVVAVGIVGLSTTVTLGGAAVDVRQHVVVLGQLDAAVAEHGRGQHRRVDPAPSKPAQTAKHGADRR